MVPNGFVYVIVVLMEETWVCLKANAKDLVKKKRLYIQAREGIFPYCWENKRKWNPKHRQRAWLWEEGGASPYCVKSEGGGTEALEM